MSVFEQLRPFVSLCQACGVIPFTIEQDLTSKKFIRFNFSFRHLTTWWFMLLLVVQLVIVVCFICLSMRQIEDLSIDPNMPIAMAVVFGVNWVSNNSQILISRWIVVHFRHLRRAIEIIQEVERLFGDKFIAQHKSSVMTRFIIGFILVVTTAIGSVTVFAPVYQSILPADMLNVLPITTAMCSIAILIFVMFDCTFFLVHLCYYIIAHYIQLLLPYSDFGVGDNDSMTPFKGTEKSLGQSSLIFGHLCKASSELNVIFSLPALLILLTKFISVVSFAYAYIYSFIHTNKVLENYLLALPFLFLTDWVRIFIFLSAADMPIIQVRFFREHIVTMTSKISHPEEVQAMPTKITAMTTLMQIDEDRVRLSAVGLFKVGMFLIPALTGAAVTYLVILLQS